MRGGRRLGTAAAGLAALLVLAACGSSPEAGEPVASAPAPSHSAVEPSRAPIEVAALEPGERWIDLGLPGGSYTPQAEAGGTDDYRCILLDPGLTSDSFLSGVVLVPGSANLVHHAILYRVDPAQVGAAEAKDAQDPRLGWSCFGGPGLPDPDGAIQGLNAAPWVAAFATTGGEQRFRAGTGHAAGRAQPRGAPDPLQPPARRRDRQHGDAAAGRRGRCGPHAVAHPAAAGPGRAALRRGRVRPALQPGRRRVRRHQALRPGLGPDGRRAPGALRRLPHRTPGPDRPRAAPGS